MSYGYAFRLGIISSLLFDVYQIYAVSNNALLSTIACLSFLIAVFGLWVNIVSGESFEFEWMGYYLIPMVLIVFSEVSIVDDIYTKAGDIADIEIGRMLPGETSDYINSYKTTVFSYFIPVLFLLLYSLYQAVENVAQYINKKL